MKKKVLILTLNDYIIYQPTILNLYDFLSPHFEVEVVSLQPYHTTKKKDEERNITYLKPGFLVSQFLQKTDFILSRFTKYIRAIFPKYSYYYLYYNKYLPELLRGYVRKIKKKPEIVIAVDLQTLFLAQQMFGPVHFLSLEIDNNTNSYYRKIDHKKIKSVLVQSRMRYEYMFPGKELKVFYVQNAPVYNGVVYDFENRNDFIWAGAIDKRLAIIEVLDFFKTYPQYKMVLKGGANKKMLLRIHNEYKELLDEKRISINQDYLKSEDFIRFLSGFKFGFVFYQWDLIRESFNYQSAPSGKLFMYFAAGIPVIAANIPGFQLIREFQAGVLVDNYEPETIFNAVRQIENDYRRYSEGCYRAAEHFSFDKSIQPYLKFLLEDSATD